MLREETHQHTALRALSVRTICDHKARRAEPGEPRRHHRPPPPFDKGDVGGPRDQDEPHGDGHGQAERVERPDPEECTQAGPEEDPHPAKPQGRAPERTLALERGAEELADEVSVDLDARNLLFRTQPGAERRVEVVLDALGGHSDQDDAASYQLGRHFAPQDGAERDPLERPGAGEIVDEELVTTGVQADIRPIVRPEGTDRGRTELDDGLVGGIGAEPQPLRLQIVQGQAEGERVQRRLAVVQEEKASPHDAARVDDDVVEAHLLRAFHHPGRCHPGRGAVGELRHHHDRLRPAKNKIELERARRHRHVSIDVQPDCPGTEGEQRVERLRQHGVGERPGALLLDVALADGHHDDARVGHRVRPRRPDPEEAVVMSELRRLEEPQPAQAQHDRGDGEGDHDGDDPTGKGGGQQESESAHLRTPPARTGSARRPGPSPRGDPSRR